LPPESRTEFDGDVLLTEFLEVTSLLQSSCADFSEDSTFIVSTQHGVAASPEGLLPSMIPLQTAESSDSDWQKLVTNSARTGDHKKHGQVLRGYAQAQQARGDYRGSANTLSSALDSAKEANDPYLIAASLGDLGHALLAVGKRNTAEEPILNAIKVASQTNDNKLIATLYNGLGNHHVAQGRHEQALNAYQLGAKALGQVAARADAHVLESVKAHANIARVLVYQSNNEQALQALSRAESELHSIAGHPEHASLLIHLAKTYQQIAASMPQGMQSSLLNAHSHLQLAKNSSQESGDLRLLSYALGNLGALYRMEKRYSEALVLTRQALVAAEQAQAPESIYRWHWQEAQLLQAQGDQLRAAQSYRRAISVIDGSRQATLARYDSADDFFKRLVEPVYLELADLLLQTEKDISDAAYSQKLLVEAREIIEKLKTAELQNYFSDECVLNYAEAQKPLEQVSPTTAVIYPIVLPDRIELLASIPDVAGSGTPESRKISRYTVPVGADELAQHVRLFRQHVDSISGTESMLAESQWLYDRLILPFVPSIEQKPVDTLVFVPTGSLRLVPMAALHNGENFIVHDYAVAMTSGLSLTDPQPLTKRNNKVLLGGISDAVGEFPALDSVPGELFAVQKLYGGDVLLNEDFTVERFRDSILDTDYSIIHIASHAQFTGDSSGNFLRVYDKPMYLDDLNNALSKTKFRDRPLELLVLSACQTASGDERAALGLAGVGIKAGARSALASLWSIGDESAAELVESFYSHLKENDMSKAEALRHAQLALLDQPQFAHPFHWSAFMLIDNWL